VVRNTSTVDEAVDIYLKLRKAKFSHDTWVNDRSQLLRLARHMNGLQIGSITPERMGRRCLLTPAVLIVKAVARPLAVFVPLLTS